MASIAKQLSEREIEEEYNISARTLQGWRTRKKGPPYRKVNGTLVRYDRAEFERWLDSSPRFLSPEVIAGVGAIVREASGCGEPNSKTPRQTSARRTIRPSTG